MRCEIVSLQHGCVNPVPEQTARVARAAFPRGNPYLKLRDELGTLFTDADFSSLFPVRGQPAFCPWRLALVTIMQYVEGLSDRQAADAVRARIDWKYALGLELSDPGFDSSILSEFRSRLLEGQAEQLLFTKLLEHFRQRKLLRERGKQRTDSTHVLASVRTLNRLELVGEMLRQALNQLAVIAPDWLCVHTHPDWPERYARAFSEYRFPTRLQERAKLMLTIGADGVALLQAAYAPAAPNWLREVPAVELLRQVWVQNYYQDEAGLQWRGEESVPPAAVAICSPTDPEAHLGKKRTTVWVGYKCHLTETCEADLPHLITQVTTTPAPTRDSEAMETIQTGLQEGGLLPAKQLVDGGYVDADLLVSSKRDFGIELVGPAPEDTSWQAREGAGFAGSQFKVDWVAEKVSCPEGKVSVSWKTTTDRYGNETIEVRFGRSDCRACGSREQCTRSRDMRRTLTLRPQAQYEALQRARERQGGEGFREEYACRAGVEGTISQGVRGLELRRCRYVGQAKTHLQHLMTAAAVNIVRVWQWLDDRPRAKTRQSAFIRLMLQPVPISL